MHKIIQYTYNRKRQVRRMVTHTQSQDPKRLSVGYTNTMTPTNTHTHTQRQAGWEVAHFEFCIELVSRRFFLSTKHNKTRDSRLKRGQQTTTKRQLLDVRKEFVRFQIVARLKTIIVDVDVYVHVQAKRSVSCRRINTEELKSQVGGGRH